MCLDISSHYQQDKKKYIGRAIKTKKVYKVLDIRTIHQDSIGFFTPYRLLLVSSKRLISNRLNKQLSWFESGAESIYEGIHVYTNIEYAKQDLGYFQVIVECEANINDLVAVDTYSDEAVFLKIKLKKIVHFSYKLRNRKTILKAFSELP